MKGRGATENGSPGDGRIVTRGVARRFGDKLALAPASVEIGPGGITGLLGPNGSGKSTFMRVLTGLVAPDAGSARVDGVELAGDGTAIRRRATYSPGELHMYAEMRADEHLQWLLRGRGAGALARATELARELGLPMRKRVRGYSHGMKRQLLFAAALAPRVRVRILDEPTEGLDPSLRGRVLDLLREDAAAGTTILLSSHHLGEVDRACDRMIFMNEGRMIADESASAVTARAARLVRLEWPGGSDLERIERSLAMPGVKSVVRTGTRLSVLLQEPDARPFLAALTQLDRLPAPASIEHGKLSLHELYRDLYGVEGC